MIYRTARLEEIPLLAQMRKQQLLDEGLTPIDIDEELPPFFEKKMKDGSLVQWVAEENRELVATAAIIFYEFPPSYSNKTGLKGYIANVYTRPDYRRRGLAKTLMEKLVEEAEKRGVFQVWLGASKWGRPLYEKLGFATNPMWMEIDLRKKKEN